MAWETHAVFFFGFSCIHDFHALGFGIYRFLVCAFFCLQDLFVAVVDTAAAVGRVFATLWCGYCIDLALRSVSLSGGSLLFSWRLLRVAPCFAACHSSLYWTLKYFLSRGHLFLSVLLLYDLLACLLFTLLLVLEPNSGYVVDLSTLRKDWFWGLNVAFCEWHKKKKRHMDYRDLRKKGKKKNAKKTGNIYILLTYTVIFLVSFSHTKTSVISPQKTTCLRTR